MRPRPITTLILASLVVLGLGAVATGTAQAAAGGPSWKTKSRGELKGVGETRGVKTISVKPFKLKTKTVTIECQKAENTGTLIGGNPGRGAAAIDFVECTVAGKTECKATSLKAEKGARGEIIVAGKTALVYPKGKAEGKTEALDAFVPEGEGAEGAAGNNLFVEFELTGGAANCGTLNLVKGKVKATGTEITRPPFRRKCGVLARVGKIKAAAFEVSEAGKEFIEGGLEVREPPITEAELWTGSAFTAITCGLEAFGEKAEEVGVAEDKTIGPEEFGWEIGGAAAREPVSTEAYGYENEGEPNLRLSCVGELINSATGNLVESQTDIAIGGRGPGLKVTRTYNSLLAAEEKEPGPFGYGWTGPYSAHLVEAGETATVYQDNGSTVVFHISSGEYVGGSWVQATLTKEGTAYIYTLPDQTKLEFNSEGRLTKETERNGNSNTLTYNKSNLLEKVTDGDSRTVTFTYNKAGQVETVTDPMKRVISYTYSSEQLASVTIEGKVRWELEYESPHLLKKIIDGRKHATTNEYEATTHRVAKQTIAGHERKFKYGTNETTITDPNGSETFEAFNSAGEPTKITRAKGVSGVETTREYEYEAGTYARTKLKDGNGHETTYGYDSEGNKTSEQDPSGDEHKWKYDKAHDIESETTPEDETTTIKRNADGDPEVIERPIGSEVQKTKYVYDAKGDIEEETNPLGDTTKYSYDAAGDREIEKDPEGNERKWKYDEDSQEAEETSPRKFTTTTERDERGLPVKITDPLGHTTEYKYDGNSNIESETDGNKDATEYEYNEENLPIKVEEANGDHTETEYDSEGKMTVHKDGNGHKWEYKRNQLEQVTEEVNPLTKVTKKKYDKAGNLETLETPETEKTTYKYDESNRLKEITYSTGKPSTVTYEYNKDSKVTKMTDETGTTKNTYDKLDRLSEAENGAKKVVKYGYNLDNEPTTITYPNGKAVTREYDKDTRLERVTDWNSNATKLTYGPDSAPEKTAFPSGTEDEDTYGYNEADQMTEVKIKGPGGAGLGTLAYTRGGDGEVTKTTTTVLPGPASSEDKYDAGNRLTEDNKLAYEYDKANNPTEIEGAGTDTYNAADELEKGPTATYAYNGDGQRTETAPTTGPTVTYGYDQAGNLTSLKRPEKAPITKIEDSFTYNGNNLRSAQDINGTTTNLTRDTAEELPLILERRNQQLHLRPRKPPDRADLLRRRNPLLPPRPAGLHTPPDRLHGQNRSRLHLQLVRHHQRHHREKRSDSAPIRRSVHEQPEHWRRNHLSPRADVRPADGAVPDNRPSNPGHRRALQLHQR